MALKFLKTCLGPVETQVWWCFWGQCEISVSKIGFSDRVHWNNDRNIKKAIKKQNFVSANSHFLVETNRFFLLPPGAYRFSGLPRIKKTKKNQFYTKKRFVYEFFCDEKIDVLPKHPEIRNSWLEIWNLEWDDPGISSESPASSAALSLLESN